MFRKPEFTMGLNTAFVNPQCTIGLNTAIVNPQCHLWIHPANVNAQCTLWLSEVTEARVHLHTLQSTFYKELHAIKEKGDVAKITQSYLDRLVQYIKDSPKNEDVAEAMLQILRVYEAQGKSVEAKAWRDKLLKEHPKSTAAKALR